MDETEGDMGLEGPIWLLYRRRTNHRIRYYIEAEVNWPYVMPKHFEGEGGEQLVHLRCPKNIAFDKDKGDNPPKIAAEGGYWPSEAFYRLYEEDDRGVFVTEGNSDGLVRHDTVLVEPDEDDLGRGKHDPEG